MKQTICVLLVLMLLLCGCGGPGETKEPQTEGTTRRRCSSR